MRKCGLRKDKSLRPYQSVIRDEIFEDLENDYQNFVISLPQGSGKTVIALATVSKLINEGVVTDVLAVLPGKELVSQWIEEARKMFYGMSLVEYKPERGITKTLRKVRYSNAVGMAMTAHSFKTRTEKEELREDMFDVVLVDEAADIILAKDFLEKYRLSLYIEGLEEWNAIKIFTQPHEVDRGKINLIMNKFGKDKTKEIRKLKISIEELDYEVKDTISVKDPDVQYFTAILSERQRRVRRNIHRLLDKLGITRYRGNVETLLQHRTARRLQETYNIYDEELENLKNLIKTYMLTRHLTQWFLYSNRPEIDRTLLADQKHVREWLDRTDKKLQTLAKEVLQDVQNGHQVYIFSKYVETAHQIARFIKNNTPIRPECIFVITGATGDEQYEELESFMENGDVLVATPVFKRGTDIPSAGVMYVFTPPFNREDLLNVVSRIRGGQLKFLAYEGEEKVSVDNLVKYLQEKQAGENGNLSNFRYLR